MATEVRVKRSKFATFINITPGSTATWARMGKGISSLSIAYNPTITDEQYIHEDTGTKETDGYAPSIDTEQTAYAGNELFDFIDSLRQSRAIGEDAETELLMVYIYDGDATSGYAAEKQPVSIAINEFGGDAGSPNKITYSVGFCGDPVTGTATITDSTVTFTEAS